MSALIQAVDFRGIPALSLTTSEGARALVSLHGAQVLSWTPAGGREWIYLSESADFSAGSSIRGGVPVCFPQFANAGPLPKHGLVRTRHWQVGEQHTGADYAIATLTLDDDAASRAIWPHAFHAEITVALEGSRLDVEFEVENRGAGPFDFTAALHSYLRVDDVELVQLQGLRGLEYRDTADRGAMKVDKGSEMIIDREVDRVYFGAPDTLLLREPHRALGIHSENFPDVVVWNPWEDICARLPDMPNLGFRRMLCVESAAVGTPVSVPAEGSWWGRQTLVDLTRSE